MKEEIIEIDEDGNVHDFREVTALRTALAEIRKIALYLEDAEDWSVVSMKGTDIIDIIDGVIKP